MNRILVIAEHDGQSLNLSTAKTIACARQLDYESLDVAVFSADETPARAAAQLEGVSRVLFSENEKNTHPLAVVLAPQIIELASGYSHVFAPGTTFGRDLLPRVAAKLNVPQISDIIQVESNRIFKRHIYAGNAVITVEAPEGVIIGTVRCNAFKPVAATGSAPVEKVHFNIDYPAHTRYISLAKSGGDRPDLQSAACVVAGGRGVGNKEGFSGIFRLADKLGAAVGASRAAVDAGFVPNDMQIGQTSKIIAPDLYFAFGISGAFQHLAGIKDAGIIIAVNTDPGAPIFEVADFGLVADLFDVIPELEKALA
ncbi:MAG: electron transfer flavoprotein subunit alpha/FixB family protein [Methylobacter sp.]